MGSDKRLNLIKGKRIRIIFRYLATAVLIWVATPQLHKQPEQLPQNPVAHQVQLVSEIEQPLSKQEVVQPVPSTPPQNTPQLQGCEAYRAEIAKYDWSVATMLAIARAESGCNARAQGDNHPINGLLAPSCGLLQVRSLKGRPTCEQLKEPATNIAWAYKIYLCGSKDTKGNCVRGYRPWSVYKNGAYKKYL